MAADPHQLVLMLMKLVNRRTPGGAAIESPKKVSPYPKMLRQNTSYVLRGCPVISSGC